MPKAPAPCVEWKGQMMTLRDFADEVGLPHGTVSKRWTKGDRGERLARPREQLQIRAQIKVQPCRVNTLLAGWKR